VIWYQREFQIDFACYDIPSVSINEIRLFLFGESFQT